MPPSKQNPKLGIGQVEYKAGKRSFVKKSKSTCRLPTRELSSHESYKKCGIAYKQFLRTRRKTYSTVGLQKNDEVLYVVRLPKGIFASLWTKLGTHLKGK